jgi:3-hydroxybutyryl-CoA dehydrogenase
LVLIQVFRTMQIVVLTTDDLKEELITGGVAADAEVIYIDEVSELVTYKDADAYIDLLFLNDRNRVNLLKQLLPKPVFVNSVVTTLVETDPSFIRINGWPTFLRSSVIEASASKEKQQAAELIVSQFNKKIEWLSDEPGFVAPRVVSMIINEAFLSLDEGVSSKEDIDTAMKLGTNYPYGPFEWAEKIGVHQISLLLQTLSRAQPRYTPAPALLRTVESC